MKLCPSASGRCYSSHPQAGDMQQLSSACVPNDLNEPLGRFPVVRVKGRRCCNAGNKSANYPIDQRQDLPDSATDLTRFFPLLFSHSLGWEGVMTAWTKEAITVDAGHT